MVFAAGQRLTAQLLNDTFGNTLSDTQNTLANVASVTYTETFTVSNTPASLVFTAPLSGKILVHNSAYLDNSSVTARTYLSFIIRTGAVIGSGTVIFTGGDEQAIENLSSDDMTAGRTIRIPGLTPGASFNIRQRGRVTSGTGEFQNRHLIVEPVT